MFSASPSPTLPNFNLVRGPEVSYFGPLNSRFRVPYYLTAFRKMIVGLSGSDAKGSTRKSHMTKCQANVTKYFALFLRKHTKMTENQCVNEGCSNRADYAGGISLHRNLANRSERAKRVRFVQTRRENFNPAGIVVICSERLSEDYFERSVQFEGSRRRFLPGSVPTVRKKGQEKPFSVRSRPKGSLRDLSPFGM